jgi:hypothetical protein
MVIINNKGRGEAFTTKLEHVSLSDLPNMSAIQ